MIVAQNSHRKCFTLYSFSLVYILDKKVFYFFEKKAIIL